MVPFLLEIGTEEIPDWMIPGGLDQLKDRVLLALVNNNLGVPDAMSVDATGRRLVLRIDGLPEQTDDRVEDVIGPPESAAKLGPSTFSPAGLAFVKKHGGSPNDVKIVVNPPGKKGNYLALERRIPGRRTADILAKELPGAISGIHWPKTMYWPSLGGPKFIRPIRWIVALLGSEVVEFECAGVTSSNVTFGHRRLGQRGPLTVTVENYEKVLEENYVIVSAAKRRAKIEAEAKQLAAAAGLQVRTDAALVEVLTYITEYPTAVMGSFDESYLSLPSEVLVTVMRHHQKYFSVEKADGSLAPHFIAVMNIPSDPEGHVVNGNQRVLRARFNDARFFYDVDQKKTLADRVEDLYYVTFHAKIGSYLEKTNRISEIARQFGGEDAARAATLCKTDLTTEMVKEFTELQGVVGGLYAKAQGENDEVAQAIYDHYKPVSMEDSIPSTLAGQALSVADKLDTLKYCFYAGLIPSGSKDPFALRRAAQGIVKILAEGSLQVSLTEQLQDSDERLMAFMRERLEHYAREIRGFAYDEVNAVLAAGWSDVPDVMARLEAIRAVRPTENFEPLAASFKRIKNILKQAGWVPEGDADASLFQEQERALSDAIAAADVSGGTYSERLERIAALRPHVDAFFDKVLVNDPDSAIRENRLKLLNGLITRFSSIADFSEIVTS